MAKYCMDESVNFEINMSPTQRCCWVENCETKLTREIVIAALSRPNKAYSFPVSIYTCLMAPTELAFELGPEPELGRGSSGIDWEDESAASGG